jgi:anti-sigma B factor antagonist
MYTSGPVIVMQLPEQLNQREAKAFCEELQPLLESDRPRVVLDGAQVRQADSAGVEMLLRCMEAAMKRDGDLKLAAVSPELATMLELTRIDRLFEMFDTASDAVESFHAAPLPPLTQAEAWPSGFGLLGDLKAAG